MKDIDLITENRDKIESLKQELLKDRTLPLLDYRDSNQYQPVIGDGNPDASIVFVGEAPGKNEALTGKPFCGASGKILDQLLQTIGLARSDVYITNIVNDRPPENRDPLPEEIVKYSPYLDKLLNIIKPSVIVILGRFPMNYVLTRFGKENELKPISEMHGREFEAKSDWGDVSIIPLYHPAASIYNQKLKQTLLEDFKLLGKYVKNNK